MQNLLAQSFFTGTIPIEVVGEVAEAKRILRNVIAIDNLKSSLQRGMAKTSSVTKIFDPKGIEVSHVEAQVNQAMEIMPEDRFGELKQLIPFSQFVCEMRRSLMAGSWDTVVHLLERIVLPGNVEDIEGVNSSSNDIAEEESEYNIRSIGRDSKAMNSIKNVHMKKTMVEWI